MGFLLLRANSTTTARPYVYANRSSVCLEDLPTALLHMFVD